MEAGVLTSRERRYLEMLEYHGPWPGNPHIYVFFMPKGAIIDLERLKAGAARAEDMKGMRLVSKALSNSMGFNAIRYNSQIGRLNSWVKLSPRIAKLLRLMAWPDVEI